MKRTALAIATCALLVCLLVQPRSSAEVTVVSLSHSPEDPTPDDEVTVTIQLTNSSEVNKTYLAWCQSNPELCFTPKEMKYIGSDAYTLKIGKYPDGQGIKYNVTIMLKDGNSTVTPTYNYTVHKPSNGNGNNNNNTNNNTNTTGNGTNGETTPNYLPYIVLAVVVLVAISAVAVIMMRRKKPGRQ